MRILIVGAGGFGREVAAWLRQSGLWTAGCTFGGFLDANPDALRSFTEAGSVVGHPDDFPFHEDDRLICAIGDPVTKLRVCGGLVERGARFENLIHNTSIVGDRVRLGTGCVLCPGSVVTCDVTMGDFVTLNVHASVGHDARIGDGCTLSGHADVTGGCHLGPGVLLGSHAAVLPRVTVGARAVVGAGSVVHRTVDPDTTVFGVPARSIYSRG